MTRFVRFFLKPLVALLFILPRSGHFAVGRFIGWLWFDVLRVRRKIVLENLKKAFPQMSESERLRLAKKSMQCLGRSLVDVAILPFINKSWTQRHCQIQGRNYFEQALEKKRGIIFLSLHLGCGDLAAVALSHSGIPLNIISKEFKSAWLNQLWFSARRKHGIKFIADRKSSFEILRALRNNEVVVFVLDQYMGPPLGVKTYFFGHPTGTAMGLALIAERAECPVLLVYTYYDSTGKAVVFIEPPIALQRKNSRDETILHMTQVYCDHIERIVRTYPEQWMWVHRRWKEFR